MFRTVPEDRLSDPGYFDLPELAAAHCLSLPYYIHMQLSAVLSFGCLEYIMRYIFFALNDRLRLSLISWRDKIYSDDFLELEEIRSAETSNLNQHVNNSRYE